MTTIKPPALSEGDRIGIISPAGPVDESDLHSDLKILKTSGFKVRLGSHVFDRVGYLAGKDEARLEDLHHMLQDDEIKAIFCTRGGYGTLRLLKAIHYDLIGQKPKIIVGYSDITALLLAIHSKTGLITFHGPMVRGLVNSNKGNWDSLMKLLTSHSLKIDLSPCSVLRPGKVSGPLIGGNLSMICHLLGTPFLPSLEGCIFFIEDRGEPLYRLDRMLTHLMLTGKLKGISALIAGQFEGCGDKAGINRLLNRMVSDLDIPLVTEFPVGHGNENFALPIGLTAELDTERMTLTAEDACVG